MLDNYPVDACADKGGGSHDGAQDQGEHEGADGVDVGTVDRVVDDRIKLASVRNSPTARIAGHLVSFESEQETSQCRSTISTSIRKSRP